MRGCAGSLRSGLVPPGTIEKSTLKVSHPAWLDEKSGGEAFCCAAAAAASAAQPRPAKTPAASNFAVEANRDMVCLLCTVRSKQGPDLVRECFPLSRLFRKRRGKGGANRGCRVVSSEQLILRRFDRLVTAYASRMCKSVIARESGRSSDHATSIGVKHGGYWVPRCRGA